MAVITNIEITNFIAKAQLKQIDLASCYVDSDGEDECALALLTELSNFIDTLDSPYNALTDNELLRTVHYLSHKAKLNAYPVVSFPSFNSSINIIEHVVIEEKTVAGNFGAYLKSLPGFGANKVLAADANGEIFWTIAGTTPTLPKAMAVTNVVATPLSDSTIKLTWTNPS